MRRLRRDQVRRAVLGAQGFADKRPSGSVDVRHFRRAMDRMGVLQLDSVNVVARSHFLPMFARLGAYDRERLDRWLWQSREGFEYFAHVASITPMSQQPLLRYRMAEGWEGGRRRLDEERPGFVDAVMAQVEAEGPLTVGDLHDAGDRGGSWWGWSPGKVALHWLYLTGRLAVENRDSAFTLSYDLPERVIPDEVRTAPTPSEDDAILELVAIAVRSAGVGTVADIADWFRVPVRATRAALEVLVAQGRAVPVEVDGWGEPAFADPELSVPRSIDACTLLTPFDPVVWFRPRAERIFDFHYRIEIYVPAAKRVYGYYVLPLLVGDRLVGRIDLKADRQRSVLMAKGCYVEAHADVGVAAEGAARALDELAVFLGLDEVEVGRTGDLSTPIREVFAR